MATLRTRLFGSRFRLGNAVGLLLVQDHAAANSNSGAIQRKSLQSLKDSFLSLVSPHVPKTRASQKCPCRTSIQAESGTAFIGVSETSRGPWHCLVNQPELGSWSVVSQLNQTRGYSTDQKQRDATKDGELTSADEKVPSEKENFELEDEKKPVGVLERFKAAYKEYGKVLICVHVATSALWFSSFYYAAHTGVDIIPVLKSLGFSDTLVKPFTMPGVGNAAVAYLLYKLATPVRYTVTIGGTQLAVRQLRRLGYIDHVPQGHSIRDLAKQSASHIKTQYSDMKDDMKDKYADVKDEFSALKYNVKDKYSDLREDVKTKMDDWKTEQKTKPKDVNTERENKSEGSVKK